MWRLETVEIKLLAAAIILVQQSTVAEFSFHGQQPIEYLLRSGGCIAAVWRLVQGSSVEADLSRV